MLFAPPMIFTVIIVILSDFRSFILIYKFRSQFTSIIGVLLQCAVYFLCSKPSINWILLPPRPDFLQFSFDDIVQYGVSSKDMSNPDSFPTKNNQDWPFFLRHIHLTLCPLDFSVVLQHQISKLSEYFLSVFLHIHVSGQ